MRVAYSSEHSTTAAEPSPIGEHISNVSGEATTRLSRISSTVRGMRYWALGFRAPWALFLAATLAKSMAVAPLRPM
ncbi:hypothetical protein Z051_03840 [Rhodococcus rhodochrous KG-21]|uniref:Uncharacterized protein n=1 Tax=Rhodococcus rhodochrous KG-21 TaxID=1441923 RepID=A0A0M9WQC1_RHORH|nr:hypothetical protein Z051_03840 [Rhodococcus rhodochrous KG-21]